MMRPWAGPRDRPPGLSTMVQRPHSGGDEVTLISQGPNALIGWFRKLPLPTDGPTPSPRARQRRCGGVRLTRSGPRWLACHRPEGSLRTSPKPRRRLRPLMTHCFVPQSCHMGATVPDIVIIHGHFRPTASAPARDQQQHGTRVLSKTYVELAKGLEPSTPCLQDRCATDCATPARPARRQDGAGKSTRPRPPPGPDASPTAARRGTSRTPTAPTS
jgi:hypothetical protein